MTQKTPKQGPRTYRKNFRIRVDLYQQALALAQLNDTTFTDLVHEGLRLVLDKVQTKQTTTDPEEELQQEPHSDVAELGSPEV